MNKLNWYLNRLLLMSPPEIVYRAGSSLKHKLEAKGKHKLSVPQPDLSRRALWYFDLSRKDLICEAVRKHKFFNEQKAQALLDHQFSFFSLRNHPFGTKIDWHRDYKNNKQAPLKFSKSIDYRDSQKIGDIKYIWEPNRHLHLVSLAKAYYLTGNESYKKEVLTQIENWIDENPYLMGVNWESSLETGIRLISWSWVWVFIGPLDPAFQTKWLESIYKHCYFTSRHLSRHSSANNHLIGEVTGLFVGSVFWPHWPESKEWQKLAFNTLVAEMEKQNYSDGVNKEQAISYQRFVLDLFVLAGLLGNANGIKFPSAYWDRLKLMLEYVASLMDCKQQVANIGDADDGYAIVLSDDPSFNVYTSLLASGAVIFERGDFKSKAGSFDEKSFWLLGLWGLEAFDHLKAEPFVARSSFLEGGYYIFTEGEGTPQEIKTVFDCGPLGYLSIAAHGHADALSFTLTVGGMDLIVDPGTYAYHSQKEWRDYFKGTGAHNTVRIDGVDQSVSGGNFMWLKKAKASVKTLENTADYARVVGFHDGYERLSDPVRHEREMIFDKKKRTIKIIDRLHSKAEHRLEQFFHCSKDSHLQKDAKGYLIEKQGKKIRLRLDSKLQTEVVTGQLDPIQGWQSTSFDIKHKSPTVVNRLTFKGECVLETVIEIVE